MAKAEGVERGYVGSLLRLTLLPPAMVEAILDGRQPEGVTLPGLLDGMPVAWGERRETPSDSAEAMQRAWKCWGLAD
jgi:hypothetical protein